MRSARRDLRQTTTTCDRVKHSIDDFDDVFEANIKSFVHLAIQRNQGNSRRSDMSRRFESKGLTSVQSKFLSLADSVIHPQNLSLKYHLYIRAANRNIMLYMSTNNRVPKKTSVSLSPSSRFVGQILEPHIRLVAHFGRHNLPLASGTQASLPIAVGA